MNERIASCSCGKLAVSTRGEPLRVSICHCLGCQKRTGSVFGAQARFAADAVDVQGESKVHVRIGDQGSSIRFHFCPQCGATVFYRMDAMPDVVAIPVGAFADPDFPQPQTSVYGARQHPWVKFSDGIERLD